MKGSFEKKIKLYSLPSSSFFLPPLGSDNPSCTKSLRDSFGLTTLVRLEGILWCAALGRTRHTVRMPGEGRCWQREGASLSCTGAIGEARASLVPALGPVAS